MAATAKYDELKTELLKDPEVRAEYEALGGGLCYGEKEMQKIIRDDGPATMALMLSWGLGTTCYVQGCEENANTIITGNGAGNYILCEDHFQQGNVPGGTKLTVVFPGATK